MLDKYLNELFFPTLNTICIKLRHFGIRANWITFLGLVFAFLLLLALSFGYFYLCIFFVLMNRICDGLDGCLARLEGPSNFGGFIDIVFDFVFYSFVPLGFAIYAESNYFACVVLLTAFYINGGTFLGFASIASKNCKSIDFGKKSIYYSDGLIEGTETVIFFSLFCLFPDYFNLIAYIFAGLTLITAGNRIRLAADLFKN